MRLVSVALLLSCLLLPLALFVFKAVGDRVSSVSQARHDTEDRTGIYEQQAFSQFEAYQLVASVLDEHIRGLTWPEVEASVPLHDYVAALVRRYPWIRNIALIDRDGKPRLSVTGGASLVSLQDRDYFARLRERDEGIFVGGPARPPDGAEDEINVARRRSSADGSFDGVILVSTSTALFVDFWQHGTPEDLTLLYLSDGRLLACYPPPENVTQTRISDPLLAASRSADRGTFVSYASETAQGRLMSFQKLPGFPVFVAHGVQMRRVLHLWRTNALRDAVFFLVESASLFSLALAVIRHSRREASAHRLLLQRTDELTLEASRRSRPEADLGAVLRDTVERQEAERQHLARELHDSLGQHAAVLHMGLESVLRGATNPGAVREQVGRLKTTAMAVSVEISRLAWELRPAGLDELGLAAALRSFVETTARRSGLQIDLHITPGEFRLAPEVEATLYRVVQEALTNIIKHAEASRADIMMEIGKRGARLIIEDDGKGFVWGDAQAGQPGKRLGLLGMRERLSLVGGSLEVESSPGHGATFFISVPA
jgi:signal transduction histidine kinase